MGARHVLFALHDAGGTVPPVLAIAQRLTAAGDTVTILSQAAVRDRAVSAGCRFVEVGLPDYDRAVDIEAQLDLALRVLVSPDLGEELLEIARGEAVDVVVVDPNLAGALAAAETLAAPTVVLLHSLYATFVDVWFNDLWPLLARPINATRAHFGRDACADWASLFDHHDLVISPVPAAFDVPTTRGAPEHMKSFGFLVPTSDPSVAVDLPRGGSPLVLAGMTTTYHEKVESSLLAIIDALATLDVRALVTTAGYTPQEARQAPNVRIMDYAPHPLLLPEAAAMVCHGGMGTVAAALDAGVPMVCLPLSRDQPLNAQRAAQLGAAFVVDEVSPDAVAEAVRRVLDDDSYRDAARSLADQSRREGGPQAAADAIRALAG